jgi:anti-sigma B factor antagonist
MKSNPSLPYNIRWVHAQIAVAELQGIITCANVPQLRKVLLNLSRKGLTTLIIDLTQVCYLDCAGIAIMVEILRTLTAKGKKLRLAGLNRQLFQVVRLTSLDQVFEIHATVEEALLAEHQNQCGIKLSAGGGPVNSVNLVDIEHKAERFP